MFYSVTRPTEEDAIIVMYVTRAEADSICHDMNTGDDSPMSSKLAFRAFMKAASNRNRVEYESG